MSQKECPHTPKCPTHCRYCHKPLPSWDDVHELSEEAKNNYVVEFEKGIKHCLMASNKKSAEMVAKTGMARAAGLCFDHMVRVVRVVRVDAKP